VDLIAHVLAKDRI
jgi:uncharacterized membrane-anchored protein YjiN (DUF445 family)